VPARLTYCLYSYTASNAQFTSTSHRCGHDIHSSSRAAFAWAGCHSLASAQRDQLFCAKLDWQVGCEQQGLRIPALEAQPCVPARVPWQFCWSQLFDVASAAQHHRQQGNLRQALGRSVRFAAIQALSSLCVRTGWHTSHETRRGANHGAPFRDADFPFLGKTARWVMDIESWGPGHLLRQVGDAWLAGGGRGVAPVRRFRPLILSPEACAVPVPPSAPISARKDPRKTGDTTATWEHSQGLRRVVWHMCKAADASDEALGFAWHRALQGTCL